MSRGYSASILCDYICKYCGNVNNSFESSGSLYPKFSERIIYCGVCQCETINYKLGKFGDRDIIKADLDSYPILEGIEFEIWDLLNANEARKQLIKK